MASKVGNKIGKYELVAELGQGGMGVVYKARDPFIGRLVALKTIAPDLLSNSEIMERFRREARAAGTLQHPNIVTIYDSGEADGRPYIAMEFVEGENLQSIINRRARIPLAAKLKLVVQFCEALSHAHKHGFVHRDVKPGNILVTNDGNVKVVDFGIVHLESTHLTKTGTFLGTIHYASPEQINDGRVDSRSDLWSATCVVYEFIAYKRAFDGTNVAAIIGKILSREPDPLSRCCPGVPPGLDAIISKGLKKNLDDRYQSLDDMLSELFPIARNLQQSFIGNLIVEARELRDKGDLNGAKDKVRAALILDNTHGEAKRLQTEISQAIHQAAPIAKVRQMVAEAERALSRGEIAESIRILAAAQELSPADTQARNLMAKAQVEQGRQRELREALNAGQKAIKQGDLTQAEQVLNRVLQLDKNNSQAAELLGQIQQDRQARERDFRLKEGLWQADNLVYAGNYEDAQRQLLELQTEFPDSEDLRLKLQILDPLVKVRQIVHEGQQAFDQGEFGEAVRLFTEALKLDPHDQSVRDLRDRAIQERDKLREVRGALSAGQQAMRAGDDSAADLEFQRAFHLDPGNEQAATMTSQARQERVTQNQEAWLRAAFQRYDEMFAAGRFDEAELALLEMQQEFPATTPVGQKLLELERQFKVGRLFAEGQQAYNHGEFAEAVRLLTEAQGIDPTDARLEGLKAQALDERDRLRQVREAIAAGQRAARQGNPEFAELEYKQALELDPANDQAAALLAEVQEQRRAREWAEYLSAAFLQVESLIKGNKLDEAGSILSQLQQDYPDAGEEVKARLQKLNRWREEALALASASTSPKTAGGSPAGTSIQWAEELRRNLQTAGPSRPGSSTPSASKNPQFSASSTAALDAATFPKTPSSEPAPASPSLSSLFGQSDKSTPDLTSGSKAASERGPKNTKP